MSDNERLNAVLDNISVTNAKEFIVELSKYGNSFTCGQELKEMIVVSPQFPSLYWRDIYYPKGIRFNDADEEDAFYAKYTPVAADIRNDIHHPIERALRIGNPLQDSDKTIRVLRRFSDEIPSSQMTIRQLKELGTTLEATLPTRDANRFLLFSKYVPGSNALVIADTLNKTFTEYTMYSGYGDVSKKIRKDCDNFNLFSEGTASPHFIGAFWSRNEVDAFIKRLRAYMKANNMSIYEKVNFIDISRELQQSAPSQTPQQKAQDKPVGCIEVNGKRIDVKKLVQHVSGGLHGRNLRALVKSGDIQYSFDRAGDQFVLDVKDIYKGHQRRVGEYPTIADVNPSVKALIQDAVQHKVVLDNLKDIIWGINPVSQAPKPTQANPRSEVKKFEVGKTYKAWEHKADEHSLIRIDGRTDKMLQITIFWWWSHDSRSLRVKLREDSFNESIYIREINHLTCSSYDIASDSEQKAVAQSPQSVEKSEESQQISAIARILNQKRELVGLVLSDGKQKINSPKAKCIELAGKGEISNVKAVSRAGAKPYLQGKGISLESLPAKMVQ